MNTNIFFIMIVATIIAASALVSSVAAAAAAAKPIDAHAVFRSITGANKDDFIREGLEDHATDPRIGYATTDIISGGTKMHDDLVNISVTSTPGLVSVSEEPLSTLTAEELAGGVHVAHQHKNVRVFHVGLASDAFARQLLAKLLRHLPYNAPASALAGPVHPTPGSKHVPVMIAAQHLAADGATLSQRRAASAPLTTEFQGILLRAKTIPTTTSSSTAAVTTLRLVLRPAMIHELFDGGSRGRMEVTPVLKFMSRAALDRSRPAGSSKTTGLQEVSGQKREAAALATTAKVFYPLDGQGIVSGGGLAVRWTEGDCTLANFVSMDLGFFKKGTFTDSQLGGWTSFSQSDFFLRVYNTYLTTTSTTYDSITIKMRLSCGNGVETVTLGHYFKLLNPSTSTSFILTSPKPFSMFSRSSSPSIGLTLAGLGPGTVSVELINAPFVTGSTTVHTWSSVALSGTNPTATLSLSSVTWPTGDTSTEYYLKVGGVSSNYIFISYGKTYSLSPTVEKQLFSASCATSCASGSQYADSVLCKSCAYVTTMSSKVDATVSGTATLQFLQYHWDSSYRCALSASGAFSGTATVTADVVLDAAGTQPVTLPPSISLEFTRTFTFLFASLKFAIQLGPTLSIEWRVSGAATSSMTIPISCDVQVRQQNFLSTSDYPNGVTVTSGKPLALVSFAGSVAVSATPTLDFGVSGSIGDYVTADGHAIVSLPMSATVKFPPFGVLASGTGAECASNHFAEYSASATYTTTFQYKHPASSGLQSGANLPSGTLYESGTRCLLTTTTSTTAGQGTTGLPGTADKLELTTGTMTAAQIANRLLFFRNKLAAALSVNLGQIMALEKAAAATTAAAAVSRRAMALSSSSTAVVVEVTVLPDSAGNLPTITAVQDAAKAVAEGSSATDFQWDAKAAGGGNSSPAASNSDGVLLGLDVGPLAGIGAGILLILVVVIVVVVKKRGNKQGGGGDDGTATITAVSDNNNNGVFADTQMQQMQSPLMVAAPDSAAAASPPPPPPPTVVDAAPSAAAAAATTPQAVVVPPAQQGNADEFDL